MKIAYLGTGLLGTGFVRHLLELGHEVSVWNRSAAKARSLEQDGAKVFADPAEAVRGVEQLHLTLADDVSVDAVLEPLSDAMGLFQGWNPGQLLPARAAKLAEGDFTPSFELTMARKD